MRRVFQLAAILMAGAILYLSLQSASGIAGPLYADKVQHALAYGILTALMALGWPKARLLLLIIVASVFGIGIEIAQGLGGQGRMLSGYDAIANGVGAMVAAATLYFVRK
jgi:VanZ family protein